MKPLRFTRRNLLRGGLAATAVFPLLEATRAVGQTASPRFLAMSYPNGARSSMFWPKGTGADYTMNTFTAALEPYKSKLTWLKGVRLNDALQNGALGGTVGSEHARGTGGMLTGRPLKSGTAFVSFGNTTSGWGSGISIDQYLAERIGAQTPRMPSLQTGVHVRDLEVRARISYKGEEQPVPPREDPADVFAALFDGVAGGDSTENSAELDRLRAQRKSLFDLTLSETNRVKAIVGAEDKARIDAHMESIRDIEQRLTTASAPPSEGAVECAAPSIANIDLLDDTKYAEAGKLHMDLVVAAFACDITRIATLQWSYSESEHLFQFLSLSGNHHDLSHDFGGSGPGFDGYNAIQTWYQQQFAYLLSKMEAYNEGEGTLLDNSLVLWATEIGESTQHALTSMPYVLAGGAAGAFTPGRVIDYGNAQQDNNQMLISIAHLMGVTDLTEFGDPSGKMDTLPDLI